MDQRYDIERTLIEHKRRPVRRWRCRCDRLWPCTAWQLAAEQMFDLNCRAALDRAIAQMRNAHPQSTGDQQQWTPHKTSPSATNSRWR